MRCPTKFGRLQDGIRKVDLSATAQSLRIAFIHRTEDVSDYELAALVAGFADLSQHLFQRAAARLQQGDERGDQPDKRLFLLAAFR